MNVKQKTPVKNYHHGSLRDACLQEGLVELQERGATHFSLREVARRAGVTPTAIYHHFPDKDDLLADLAFVGLEEFRTKLQDSVLPGKTPQETLTSMGVTYLDFFQRQPYYLDLLFSKDFARHPEVKESRSGAFHLVTTLLEKFGIPVEETDSLALWIWSAVHGLATLINAEALGNVRDECPEEAPRVFHLDLDELKTLLLPLFSRIVLALVPKT
jgi:AcrR family transcriptional regulator